MMPLQTELQAKLSHFGIRVNAAVPFAAMASAYPAEYREFLQRLKAARVEAGLTQWDVARLLDKPQSFVSKTETGERRLDPVELRHLAEIYGKPFQYFV